MYTNPLGVDTPPESATRDVNEGANTCLLVTLCLQDAVNEGRASWRLNRRGQAELHLNSGDAYLLLADGICRLK